MSDRITREIKILLNVEGKEVVGTISNLDTKLESLNKKVKQHATQFGQTSGQITAGTGQMNAAFGQLGYLLSDVDMFLVNFRMGMMSVANNIPIVVQQFAHAKNAINNTGTSIKDVLLSSLKGPGGLMLVVGGLTTLMNVLAFAFEKNRQEIKETAKETKNLAEEYKNLGSVQLEERKQKLEVDLKSAIRSRDNLVVEKQVLSRITPKGTVYKTVTEITDETEYEKRNNEVKELKARLGDLTGQADSLRTKLEQLKEGIFPLNSINDIKEAMRLWNIELDSVNSQAERNTIVGKIDSLKEMEKQFRNEGKERKAKDILKENKRLIKKIANEAGISKAEYAGDYSFRIPMELKPIPPDKMEFMDALRELETVQTFEETAWATTQISAVTPIGNHIQRSLGGAFRKVFGEAHSFMGDLLSNIASALIQLGTMEIAKGIWNKGGDAFGQIIGAIGSIFSFAGGGYVVGAGNGTSDSIPAFLSNGEFVINEKSTRAFFPLLEAINNYDRIHTKPIINKFSNGGLVGRSTQVLNSLSNAGNYPTNINLTGELKLGLRDLQVKLKRLDELEKRLK